MEFKDNLKQLRMKKGLTQAQLAEKLVITDKAVSKWIFIQQQNTHIRTAMMRG